MVHIREEYDDLKSAITAISPFLSSLLRKMRILITQEPIVPLAATTENDELILNEKNFEKLSFKEAAWIILHEVLHIAFRDLKRRGQREPLLWNLAADGVNNELLRNWLGISYELEHSLVFMETLYRMIQRSVPIDTFMSYSKEEVYELLNKMPLADASNCPNCGHEGKPIEDHGYSYKMKCPSCGHEWEAFKIKGKPTKTPKFLPDMKPLKKAPKDSELLQEGDKELYKEKDKERRNELWKEELTKAYTSEKMAGTVPLGLKRIVERLLKPQVDWKTLFRQAFYEGYGKTIVASYSRPSRKHPDFPGIRRFTLPKCHWGQDCSGSISQEELSQALTEAYAVARSCRIELLVTPWDTEVYEPTVVKRPSDIIKKLAKRLRGWGGTEIQPWLEKVDKNMKPRDLVVVFTDGDIYDIETEEVKSLMRRIASKASVCIFLTTHREHEIQGWKTIKVKVS